MPFIRFAILSFALALSLPIVSAQEAPKPDSSPGAPPSMVPESEAALQNQLEKILELERTGNDKEAGAAIDELKMPDDAGWFARVFGPELGVKLAATYKLSWDNYRMGISWQFRSDGEANSSGVRLTAYPDSSGKRSDFTASQVVPDMKTPAPLYVATAVDAKGHTRTLPGYYVYAQGAFRILNLQTLYVLPDVKPVRIRIAANLAKTNLIY